VGDTESFVLGTNASGTTVTLPSGLVTPRWGLLQYPVDASVHASGISLTPGTFTPPDHLTPTVLDERATLINLSRNIVIQGADDTAWSTEGWGGLSVHHAITRSVRDSAALLDATHGVEPGSRYAAPTPDGSFLSQLEREPGRLRIALMRSPINGAPVDPDCLAALDQTARLCESLGHHVEEAAPKLDAGAMGQASFVLIASSLAADLTDRASQLGIELGPDVLEPITLAFVGYGKTTSGTDFARANNTMQTAAVAVAQFMADYDVILSPTLAAPPLPLGQINLSPGVPFPEWGQRAAMFTPFTQIANFTGQPSMSVPLGMSVDGLPIGMQFTGRYGEEALLYQLARQLERAVPWSGRRPAMT
ncbi:MAG: amidase family protein, partial [Erythrobacter sp.]|nr:amidase family protein [Erythrobacter sp.]